MKICLIPQKHWIPVFDSFENTEVDVLSKSADVHIFTPWVLDPQKLPPMARQNPDYSKVHTIPLPYDKPIFEQPNFFFRPENLAMDCAIIKEFDPDIIYCLFAHDPGLMGMMIANELSKPLIVSVFGFDVNVPGGNRDFRIRSILKHADIIRCETDAMKVKLTWFLPEAEPKIVVVPAAFDPSQYVPGEKGHDSEKEIILLSINRLIEVKGCIPATQSFIKALQKNSKLHWRIIGDGPLASEMIELLEEAGVRDKVSFFGSVTHEKKLEILKDADIFYAPYVEGSDGAKDNRPLSCQESFSMGLPTILGHNMGFDDIGEFTRIAEPGTDACVEAILELAANPAMRKEFGELARVYARENLDFNKNCQIILDKIEEVVKK